MLTKHLYQQLVSSPQFVHKQLEFEKSVYQRIVSECSKQTILKNYQVENCVARYEDLNVRYALFVQMLVSQRELQLKRLAIEQCKGKTPSDTFKCVGTLQEKFIKQHLAKDGQYMSLVREELLPKSA